MSDWMQAAAEAIWQRVNREVQEDYGVNYSAATIRLQQEIAEAYAPEHERVEAQFAALTAERDAAHAELRKWFGCPSCGEDHPPESMCPPPEMRTTGQAGLRDTLRNAQRLVKEAESERDAALQRAEAAEARWQGQEWGKVSQGWREKCEAAEAACAAMREVIEGWQNANSTPTMQAANERLRRFSLTTPGTALLDELTRLRAAVTEYAAASEAFIASGKKRGLHLSSDPAEYTRWTAAERAIVVLAKGAVGE